VPLNQSVQLANVSLRALATLSRYKSEMYPSKFCTKFHLLNAQASLRLLNPLFLIQT